MDGLDTKPNFGIENTSETAAGNTQLLNDLYEPETNSGDADDLEEITTEDTTTDNGENVDEETAKDPDALTSFLLGEDDEEEEETEEEEKEEEKEEEDVTTDDTTTVENEEEEETEGSVNFNALANELASLGVFTPFEGDEELEISTPEDFLKRFNLEKQKAANELVDNFISQFGQEYQDAFQAIYVDGVNPSTYFTTQNKIQNFKDMDLSIERNQESVVRKTLENQGFESEDIESEIERLKNYGDLEDVSKKHHKVLVKHEEAALKKEAQVAKEQQQIKMARKQQYMDNVNNTLSEKLKAKEFDGIPLTPQIANELQDFLLVDKWKTESGETLTDFDRYILELKKPENHATKVKIGLLMKLLEKDPTLSTIQKSGVTKKSSELFKSVARHKTVADRTTTGKKKTQPTSWFK